MSFGKITDSSFLDDRLSFHGNVLSSWTNLYTLGFRLNWICMKIANANNPKHWLIIKSDLCQTYRCDLSIQQKPSLETDQLNCMCGWRAMHLFYTKLYFFIRIESYKYYRILPAHTTVKKIFNGSATLRHRYPLWSRIYLEN